MAEFVGATVVIALNDPHGAKIRGLIINVSEGQLKMNKVKWLNTGATQKTLVVEGHNVLDLDIEPETTEPAPAPAFASAPAPRSEPVADPAILSYARPPSTGQVSAVSHSNIQPSHSQGSSHPPVSPILSLRKFSLEAQPESRVQIAASTTHISRVGEDVAPGVPEPSANLTEPFNALTLNGHVNDIRRENSTKDKTMNMSRSVNQHTVQGEENDVALKARPKRVRRKNTAGRENRHNGRIQATSIPRKDPALASQLTPKIAMGPGWRETPLTEIRDSPSKKPTQSRGNLEMQDSVRQLQVPGPKNGKASKKSRKYGQSEYDEKSGWATEEATDIQDMGDFNFEENHKKFDKKKVFEKIRQDDTTTDEARLVSFNRLPSRPGTYGGKNLHFTENVLDSPTNNIIEQSTDDDSSADEIKNGNIRANRRTSRISQQKIQSRKGSAYIDIDGQMAGSSLVRESGEDRSHGVFNEAFLSSNPSLRSQRSSSQRPKPFLRTNASDRRCPCVTPLQMLELEQLTISELNKSEDMMTENAATAIAQTARQMVIASDEQPNRKLQNRKIYSSTPLIVVLAGNHKTGSRAIAAARQLLDHSAQVVLCVLGLERETEFLDTVRRQLNIYRKCGGSVVQQSQLRDTLKGMHASSGKRRGRHITTDLIIDALLGMHLSFEDLIMEHQIAYSQLVRWANVCDGITISIDVPSGVDASTGATPDSSNITRLKDESSRTGTILQGDLELVIAAQHVLSLGAPKVGLVQGKEIVANFQYHHSWLVADIGLSDVVWKKIGLRGGHGVDFGSEWVTEVEFVAEPGNK